MVYGGQDNDLPTPRIGLGVPEPVDPEPLSFEPLGKSQKQHSMGKVYSAFYKAKGRALPFFVVADGF